MQADWAVELGGDAPVLTVPWRSEEEHGPRYFDLKRRPELLLEVVETATNRDLAEFLSAVNTPAGMLESAKCDTWTSREITAEEEIFGAPEKFGSYVDLFFSDSAQRGDFSLHESFAREMCRLLKRAPEMAASVEFVVRKLFHEESEGYYFTAYVHGYGEDAEQSRGRWSIALKVLQHALQQHIACLR